MNIFTNTLQSLISNFSPAWPLLMSVILSAYVFIGLVPLTENSNMKTPEILLLYVRKCILYIIAGMSFWASLVGILENTNFAYMPHGYWSLWFDTWPWAIGAILAVAVCLKFYLKRYLIPMFSNFMRGIRVVQADDQLSDIRNEIDAYKSGKPYLPSDYHKPNHIFGGLRAGTSKSLPIYIDWETFYETNKLVVGATRYGKGITFQVLAQQQIKNGDCLFLIDPKGDKYLPDILKQECEAAGRTFLFIDLHDDEAGGYWAPFFGGSANDKFARFCEINSLKEKGVESDHYKVTSRSAFAKIFQKLGEDTHLRSILKETKAFAGDEDLTKAMSTEVARLEEWAQRKTLTPNAKRNKFTIERAILSNAVVYVQGSIDNEVTKKATQAFIIEVLQETKRLSNERTTHLSLYIDELKFMISQTVLSGLATIVGSNASIFLAFQNFGDLLNPDDRSLDGRGIDHSVKVNCQVKYIFGGTDFKSAEYVSENSGTRLKDVTRSEAVAVNEGGGEVWKGERHLNTVEEAYITPNQVMSLPPKTGILFRPNQLATPIRLSHVPVKEKEAV